MAPQSLFLQLLQCSLQLHQCWGRSSIRARTNQLTGTIPTEFGRLASLGYLSITANRLMGRIPTELGLLPRLTLLCQERFPLNSDGSPV
ncbi:hypothetical protein BJ741DRAFT_328529 [Chytriomyces cf. hyalinus JEL632]|nr:hypothetical protein BJ741DRAFT_328529 [Chytriomyces cf. hyalinus JEL632]